MKQPLKKHGGWPYVWDQFARFHGSEDGAFSTQRDRELRDMQERRCNGQEKSSRIGWEKVIVMMY